MISCRQCYELVDGGDCTTDGSGSSRTTAFVFMLEKDDDGEEDNPSIEGLVVTGTASS